MGEGDFLSCHATQFCLYQLRLIRGASSLGVWFCLSVSPHSASRFHSDPPSPSGFGAFDGVHAYPVTTDLKLVRKAVMKHRRDASATEMLHFLEKSLFCVFCKFVKAFISADVKKKT